MHGSVWATHTGKNTQQGCMEDHFMLCGESAGLTPDTNGPPSFPCMKNQLMNVTRVYIYIKKKKRRHVSAHAACEFFHDFVQYSETFRKADYDDVQFK